MDVIADMLIRIKNAGAAEKKTVAIPYSKIKMALALLLEKNGYLSQAEHRGKKSKKIIAADLIYDANKKPIISAVSRVSKQSKRIYKSAKDMMNLSRAKGITVISTPKGLFTAKEALKMNVGGEVICRIW